jgi:shikimate dehydrogenase
MPHHPYLVGLVGTGIGPSLSPELHMEEARALGLDYVYRIIDIGELGIPPERIGEILEWARRFGFDGLNITHPCKQLVVPHLDALDPMAAALGAVNTVRFTDEGSVGCNTDTTGFAAGLTSGLPHASLDDVVLLGAGGAGSAVGDALLRLGARSLTIVDIDETRSAALADELRARHAASIGSAPVSQLASLLGTASGVVHCTPTGMRDHPGMPFAPELLTPRLWVADIVYRPIDTELLVAARAAGCRTLDGGRMAVYQAAEAFRLFTGMQPDASRMLTHFRSLVNADEALTR